MARRSSTLTYDRGALILHPPPKGKAWVEYATWDDRVERFRIPAIKYRTLIESLLAEGTEVDDKARHFETLELKSAFIRTPYPHQSEALAAWKEAGRQGVIVRWATKNGRHHFPSRRSLPISRQMLDVLMKGYGEEAVIPEDKRHFHALKHSIATHLLGVQSHSVMV